jgi:SAM-dependent methyltransferase/polysaccharide pyruvyl transferase WcaK-like protein
LISCVICSSSKNKKETIISREGELLTIIKCNNCSHWWLPEYTDFYTDGSFTKEYRGINTPTEGKIASSENTAINRFKDYSKYLKDGNSILEVGSSFGSFVKLLKIYGMSVVGLEPDPIGSFSESIYGFKQHITGIEDFTTNKKFDTVFSFHVIEHIENPHIFIKKIKDLIKHDGRLIIECPSLDIHKYGNLKRTIWMPHRHYFSISSLYWLVHKYFVIEDIWYRDGNLYSIVKKDEKKNILKNRNHFLYYKYIGKIIFYFNRLGPNRSIIAKMKRMILSTAIEKKSNYSIDKAIFRIFRKYKYKKYVNNESNHGDKRIAHITSFKPGHNAGDTVLSKNVRDIFNLSKTNFKWKLVEVKDTVTIETISKINDHDLCVIGGGGLFIPDTNPNTVSGWQWPISIENLEKITVPIIIFAVGFNYFHGQTPSKLFLENVKEIIKKSSFVGIRNHGSILQLKKYLEKKQFEKLIFQPCPTTLIRMMENCNYHSKKGKDKNIAVNIAFDRYHRRFGAESDGILKNIALAMKSLQKKGFNISVVSHTTTDSVFKDMLNQYLNDFKLVELKYSTPNDIIDFYTNEIDLVIGMRGHSQMIPFGVGCKILTLGTHNKMKYFLDDISSPDLLIDLNENFTNLSDHISEKSIEIYNDKSLENRLHNEQKELFKITQINLNKINSFIT